MSEFNQRSAIELRENEYGTRHGDKPASLVVLFKK